MELCFLLTGDGQNTNSKGMAGFYMEQFLHGMPASLMEGLMSSGMSGNHSNQEALIAGMMSQAAASSSYESAVNFALKSEKGLPPTPPGDYGIYKMFPLITYM